MSSKIFGKLKKIVVRWSKRPKETGNLVKQLELICWQISASTEISSSMSSDSYAYKFFDNENGRAIKQWSVKTHI